MQLGVQVSIVQKHNVGNFVLSSRKDSAKNKAENRSVLLQRSLTGMLHKVSTVSNIFRLSLAQIHTVVT